MQPLPDAKAFDTPSGRIMTSNAIRYLREVLKAMGRALSAI
jgi:hypothetical protein